jgi:CBS domain-containing protein
MAAILGGTMRAPLTASLFAVELTGDIHMLAPVMAASIAAFALTVLLMSRSILTERIARRGLHVTREYAIDPFLHTRVEQVMAKPVHTLAASIPVREAVDFFVTIEGPRRHKSYPVVDGTGRVIGLVSRTDVLRWRREGWAKDATLQDREGMSGLVVGYPDELVGHVADRMAAHDIGRLPIVDRASGRAVGIVARRDLLRVRAKLVHEERERRRLLRFRS